MTRKIYRSALCSVAAAGLFAMLGVSSVTAGDVSVSQVRDWADTTTVGSSKLLRTASGISSTVKTSGIPNKHAVTLWFVVFNKPGECATAPCSDADLFDPDVEADVLYAAGHVVGNGNRGHLSGHLAEGDTSGSIADLFSLPNAQGLTDAEGAEVHHVVRSHGPKIPRLVSKQISTFAVGCDVDLPPGTIPQNRGECADIQFAIDQP